MHNYIVCLLFVLSTPITCVCQINQSVRPLYNSVSFEQTGHFDEISHSSKPSYAGHLIESRRETKGREMTVLNKEKQLCKDLSIAEEDCLPEYRFDGVKLVLTEKEWKERLTPEQFKVLRKHGTEPAFKNEYAHFKEEGIYACAGCELPLFSSNAKYDSGTGWPSFWQPICPENVSYSEDNTLFNKRTEVHCSRCDGHIGHVFDDGPPPTGKRYCMNSAALTFVPK